MIDFLLEKYADVAAAYGFELRPGQATFLDQHALAVNGQPLRARTYMVATGPYSAAPDLPGLNLGLLESHVPAPVTSSDSGRTVSSVAVVEVSPST